MTLPADIFLSYSRDDQVTARRFAEGLQREGISVWWDATLRSGEAYDEVTEKALRDAKAVVVLWSKKSAVSRWVRAEATLADRNRTLVPAMIEPCERPIMFELTQTADLSRWTGDAGDPAWRTFLGDVQRFIGGAIPAAHSAAQAPAPPAEAASPHRGFRPSLAILPFANRSGDRADDVFADGMVEDLISALSLSRAIKVIAQSATIVYRKNISDLRVIGRELGVRYLLEGNVRRVGADLRVSAQLVEADTGAILWTQKFDRPLTELAALQEHLVTEVAGHLGVQVARVEMERALKKPGDLTAWEAVMRSMASNARITREGNLTAIAEARKAITIEADYALGHATLAQHLATFYFTWGGGRDKAQAHEARAHAERALELDSDDPVVLSQSALALGFCGDWHEAQKYAQRSFEINPNVATTHMVLSTIGLRFTRPEDAIRHAAAALVLAPRGQQTYLYFNYQAIAHYQAGRFEQALACVEQALMHNPGFVYALKDKAVCCEKLGRHEEARDALRRMRAADSTLSVADIEAVHLASFIAPETSVDMNATLRKIWQETPLEPTV